MVGQGPAVLAAGAVWVGYALFYFKSRLSCLPFLMPHLSGDGWTFRNIVVSAVLTQRYLSVTTGGVLAKYWLTA